MEESQNPLLRSDNQSLVTSMLPASTPLAIPVTIIITQTLLASATCFSRPAKPTARADNVCCLRRSLVYSEIQSIAAKLSRLVSSGRSPKRLVISLSTAIIGRAFSYALHEDKVYTSSFWLVYIGVNYSSFKGRIRTKSSSRKSLKNIPQILNF